MRAQGGKSHWRDQSNKTWETGYENGRDVPRFLTCERWQPSMQQWKAVSKVLFGSALAEKPQGISVHTHFLCNPRITRGFNKIIDTLQVDRTYTEQAVHQQWPSFKNYQSSVSLSGLPSNPYGGMQEYPPFGCICASQLSSPYIALHTPGLSYLSQGSAEGTGPISCLFTANLGSRKAWLQF